MAAQIFPERLREAREARGFSALAFADAIGIKRQAIFQFENGQTQPSPETFESIKKITGLPQEFFFTPLHREVGKAICWRSLKKFESGERSRIKTRFNWLRSIIRVMEDNYIDFPPINFPPVFERNAKKITFEEIENIANQLREFWGLGAGPISNMTQLLESNGVFISRIHTESASMDAVSQWLSDKAIILISSNKDIAVRFRFDLAHELGHLMLHGSADSEDRELIDLLEKQANRFASSFLMPKATFSKEMFSYSMTHLRNMKKRWKVSMAAMAYWCKDLGIMTENQHSYFCRQRNTLKIRTQEPLDNELPLEIPSILSSSTNLMLENGQNIVNELTYYNQNDMEELCQVPIGTLSPLPSNVVRIDFKNKQRTINKNIA